MLEAVVPAENVIFYPNYFFQVASKAWVCLLHTSEGPLLCTHLIFLPSLSSVDQDSKHGLDGGIGSQF